MIALVIALAVVTGGTVATYICDGRVPLTTRLSAGTCIGLTALGLAGLLAASLFGFNLAILALCAAAVTAPVALLFRREYRLRAAEDVQATVQRVHAALGGRDGQALIGFVLFLLLCAPLAIVFSRAVYDGADGVYTGIYVNRNDVPLHIDIIEGFLTGENFPPQHPEFAGARLTYPFLVDFIAAQLVQAGLTVPGALALENLLLMTALIVLLHRWARALTHDRTAALLAPLVILLGSGLGWLLIPDDARAAGTGLLTFFWHLPHDYTINTRHLRWGNLTTTVLVSQRSFLLGLPLSLIVWTLWWRAVGDARPVAADGATTDSGRQLRMMGAAGIVAGCMPLIHTHSFVVLMVMGSILSLLFRAWRAWFVFFAVAIAFAVPQLWWVSQGSLVDGRDFVAWSPGWTKETESYAWFWLKNTGPFIPLLAAAVATGRRWLGVPHGLLLFYAPFLVCFVVPQLFRLAPQPSANIKVLLYWYIASAPLVSLLLARLWRSGRALRAAALALIAALTGAATLDVWRVVSGASAVKMFESNSVAFAREVQRHTPPRAVILHAPSEHHPIFLTGRPSLLGNLLHVASHGFDFTDRAADIRSIYAGDIDGGAILQRHHVDYVVVGPEERSTLRATDAAFSRFPLVAAVGDYHLYRTGTPVPATQRHVACSTDEPIAAQPPVHCVHR